MEDVGRTLSWGALASFLYKVDIDGELAKDLAPELSKWSGTMKTNAILADIYDLLSMINANICALGSGKQARKPKEYPRPADNDRKQIGRNAVSPEELRAFFDKKRKENKKRKTQEVNNRD